MTKPLLIIGNKNYSSWSLRPWLAMSVAGIGFDEKLVPLFEDDWAVRRAELPAGKVPVLVHGELAVWESLAILEYLDDTWPEAGLWPTDPAARAHARTVAAEMHAGFTALRTHMSMNIRASHPGRGMGEGVAEDIARITQIWRECIETYGKDSENQGPFLFGRFSNADAMFAPIVSRFTTFAVEVDEVSRAYMDAVLALPAMQTWSDAAREEPWVIADDEIDGGD